MDNPIIKFKNYMQNDYYNYLYEYVENIKNNIKNEKIIIIVGTGRSSITTIIDDIEKYIGKKYCCKNIFEKYNTDNKLLILDLAITNKNIDILNNLIDNNISIIGTSYNVNEINESLDKISKIISIISF
jgi:ABC-type Mn2+/Zn2+ transport system ATPase subunit